MGNSQCVCSKKKMNLSETPTNLVLKTKYSLQDVKKFDQTPPPSKKNFYRYNCPICLCYYSKILVTRCCEHYICHYCVADLQNTSDLGCPVCRACPFKVVDVNPQASVKAFSDSYKNNWFEEGNIHDNMVNNH